MKPIRCLIVAAITTFVCSQTASSAVVSPTSVTLVQGSAYFPVGNLLDGGGTTGGATWVTFDPNGTQDYYLAGSPGPDPILVFDLGADTSIDTLFTWPYGVSGNSTRDMTLRFATEAEGTAGFGTSITFSPTLIAPSRTPGALAFNQEVTARYVEMTITDNYFEIDPPGGDRVGLAEVAFDTAPSPAEAPTVLTQPQTQTAFVGNPVTFSATVDGTQPWSFQWRKDGVNLPGATTDTLTIAAVASTDVGAYDTVVSNSVGSVTSDSALLLVKEVPISPMSVTLLQSFPYFAVTNLLDGGGVAAGATWVTDAPNSGAGDYFDVLTPGVDPIMVFDLGLDTAIDSILVWPYSNAGNSARNFNLQFATAVDGTNGFGTSIPFSPDLIAPDQPQADPRTIGFGQTVTTRYVKMTITDNYFGISPPGGDRVGMSEVAFAPPLLGVAPVVVVDPQPQATIFGAGPVIFDVDVFGSLPFSFQWRFNGVDLAGATSQILTLPNPGFGEIGDYDVVVSNVNGSATSRTAALSVTAAVIDPTAQGVVEDATATFSIETVADAYQWAKDGVDLPGETAQTLAIENVIPGDAGNYSVSMMIGTSTAFTATAALTTLDPTGRSDYELAVLSDTPRGYWRLGETSGTNAVDETGLHDGNYWNNPSLGVTGVIAGDADTAVAFSAGGQTKVDVPYSTDLNAPSFTFECWAQVTGGATYRSPITSRAGSPQAGYICYAEPDGTWDFWTGPGWHEMQGPTVATLGDWVHLAGSYDAATQTKTFYINGQIDGVATGVNVNRNTQHGLRIGGGSTELSVGEWFFEGLIDEVAVYGEALSLQRVRAHYLSGLFGGNSPPFIDGQPEDQFLVLGDTNTTVTFSAVVSGSPPLSLQWDMGGIPIPGATNDSLVITNATPTDVGTYSLTVSNSLGTAISDPADLILTTAPVVPAPQVRLEGDTTRFSVTMPADSTGYLYQWELGGADIVGATADTLELTSLAGSDSGNYTVTVILGPDSATSDPASLLVTPLPTGSYASRVAGSNPLVWWRLGEAAGSTLALDQYGFNDADIIIDTVMGAPGALLGDTDTAAEFPGTADSKVELIDTFDIATPEFSVEFWAVLAGGSGFRSPITSRDIFNSEIAGWTFYVTGANTWQFRIGDGGTAWAGSIDGPQAVPGAWTHVVGTYAGSTMRFYVDGALVGEMPGVNYLPQDFVPLWIGAGATEDPVLVGNFFWVGRVDEVAFYDRAISAGEVVDHWAAAFQPGTGPEITGQPQFAWALPGGDASFSVAARGIPLLSYQWQKDGVDVPGATGSTLVLANIDVADGGFYSVIVSNGGGAATSSAAELFVPGDMTGTYQDLVLADGPVAYWPLDELAGVVAADAVGTNDGAVVNNATLGAPGAIPGDSGTSYRFSQASTQKVEVPYSAEINPTDFTIEVWAMVTGGTGHRSPLTSRDDSPQRGFIFYADPGNNWQFWTGQGAQVGWDSIDWGQGALANGKWYHLVGTYDGVTKSFYVDGQLVGTQQVVIAPNQQQVLRIGAGATDVNPGSFFFDGGIDEVAIYDHVLSVKQIVMHYAAGVPKDLIPVLIDLQGGQITINWDGAGVLQQSEDLPGANWGDVPGTPASPYTEIVPADARSFRLRQP